MRLNNIFVIGAHMWLVVSCKGHVTTQDVYGLITDMHSGDNPAWNR